MRKLSKFYGLLFIGLILLVVGLLLKFFIPTAEGMIFGLTFILIGLGAGLIGAVVAKILMERMLYKDPVLAKQYEINEKDERNIRLREKAGYASWYSTMLMLAVITLIFLLLDYMVATFVLIGVLLIHLLSFFVYVNIYDKKI
jgi:uncharacterized membrane protein